jgi:hypothetical protein
MPVIEGTERLKVAVAEYDFAVDGGAVGSIPLRGVGVLGGAVPAGAVVHSGYVEVLTPFTSGGAATVALSLESAGDLVAAGTLAANGLSSGGRKNVTPNASGGNTVKTTASRAHNMAVAVAPLTAGKMRVYSFYV